MAGTWDSGTQLTRGAKVGRWDGALTRALDRGSSRGHRAGKLRSGRLSKFAGRASRQAKDCYESVLN